MSGLKWYHSKDFFPSLGELMQGHLEHSAPAFKPLTSVRTETMAATLSLSEMAAQHLTKNKDLRSSIAAIITPLKSGGTDTLFLGLQDLSRLYLFNFTHLHQMTLPWRQD